MAFHKAYYGLPECFSVHIVLFFIMVAYIPSVNAPTVVFTVLLIATFILIPLWLDNTPQGNVYTFKLFLPVNRYVILFMLH